MATPELTYGGFPLASDVEHQVVGFMDRHLATGDLRDVVPSIARIGSRADGLAWPNYPAVPKIRPNQVYWPTGAARWAIGYFFADDKSKQKIVTAAHPDSSTNTALELRVVQNQTFTANLFLLTPRKVSCVEGGNNVWLLPLVDERYFWQFRDIGDFDVTTASTWANMFTQFDSRLGISISADTAAANYLIPDPEELTRKHDNAGVLLDAVAHSIGQRIVRWPDGTIKSMNWSTSAAQLVDNVESKTPWQQIAGGELDFGPVPASVNVVCRRFVFHVAIPDKIKSYSEAASAHLTSPATTSGTVKTIHTTAYADFTTDGSTVDNNAALDNLAEEIASDFYDSTLNAYDRTFVGIKLWDTCGYDDHVLYQFGGEYPVPNAAGEYEKWTHTRVQSSPVNFGVEHQLSQDSTLTPLASHQFGELDEELDGTNPATFSIYENDTPADTTETGHTITSNDIEVFKFADQVIPPGVKSHAFFDFESEKWYIHPRNSIFAGQVLAGNSFPNGTGGSAWSNHANDGADNNAGGYDITEVRKDGAGSTIVVRLPQLGSNNLDRIRLAPNIKQSDVIYFSYNETGNAVAMTSYHDGALGEKRIWDDTIAKIPFGWREYEIMRGRMPIGVDTGQGSDPDINIVGTDETGDATGAGGGGSTAGNFEHDHEDDMSHPVDAHTITAHDPTDHNIDDHDAISAHAGTGPGLTHETEGGEDFQATGADLQYKTHNIDNHDAISSHVGDETGALVGLSHDDQAHGGSLGHDTTAHTIAAINHYGPLWTVHFMERWHE